MADKIYLTDGLKSFAGSPAVREEHIKSGSYHRSIYKFAESISYEDFKVLENCEYLSVKYLLNSFRIIPLSSQTERQINIIGLVSYVLWAYQCELERLCKADPFDLNTKVLRDSIARHFDGALRKCGLTISDGLIYNSRYLYMFGDIR